MTIKEITEIIDQNFTDPAFNINALRHKLGISYSVLYEGFVQNLKFSPRIALENKRIEKALILLSQNNKTICEICSHIGYANTKTLRNVLKKRFNKSPSQMQDMLSNLKKGELEETIDRLIYNTR